MIDSKEGTTGKKIFGIPVSEGQITSHFGHVDQFSFVATLYGKIVGKWMFTPPTHEQGVPMDLPESLVNQYLSESLSGGDNICDH